MNYLFEKLTHREFEVLAANYAKSVAPQYQWRLTQKTIDFNRDFESVCKTFDKWGEAKHTKHPSTPVSKNRWDPTLVSAVLKNNVDEIFLITCGWIPLEYIARAEHFKIKKIKKIYYINRYLLNNWLKNSDNLFHDFGEKNIDIYNSLQRIKISTDDTIYKNSCLIRAYDVVGDILEPIKKLVKCTFYEINITLFFINETEISICLPDSFEAIKIISNNLSRQTNKIIRKNEGDSLNFDIEAGYSQVLIYGFFNDLAKSKEKIILTCGSRKTIKTFEIVERRELNNLSEMDLAKAENEAEHCMLHSVNSVVYTNFLQKNDLFKTEYIETDKEYNYYTFSNSICNNAVTLCKIISKLVLGIDHYIEDEKILENTINNTLMFCPFWLSNVFIGTSSYFFAISALKYLNDNISLLNNVSFYSNLSRGSLFFVDNYQQISSEFKNILAYIIDIFKTQNHSNLLVLNSNFSTESPKIVHTNIIDMVSGKTLINEQEQSLLARSGEMYYEQSDFFKARLFYDLIDEKHYSNSQLSAEHIFKYADCLNHCGSMKKSQEQFERLIELYDGRKEYSKLLLEAKTEIINLKFWRLETNSLIDAIDNLLTTYRNLLITDNGSKREKYAFYNCLNRKMVTLYLMGRYDDAETIFNEYVTLTEDKYKNYRAFAYMDSARGLYSYDLMLAYARMNVAHELLSIPSIKNKEKRRYLDCLVELEYIKFIIDYENGKDPDIEPLKGAITNIRINGYKNMLIKCYLKLATCFIAKKELHLAKQCLEYVKNNCDFSDNTRASVLYHKITSSLYEVEFSLSTQYHNIALDYHFGESITFNPKKSYNKILLESRVW